MKYKVESGNPRILGVSSSNEGLNFSIVSKKQACSLILYEKGTDLITYEIPFPSEAHIGNIYSMVVGGLNFTSFDYNFKIGNEIVQDPYARVVKKRGLPGKHIACGFSLDKYDWEDDKSLEIPYEDTIIYAIHPRGFTKQKDSGVKHKGTFAGIIEKLHYLESLGVNLIELMPSYNFSDEIKWEPKNHKMLSQAYRGLACDTAKIESVKCDFTLSAYKKFESEALSEQKKINYWGYGHGEYFALKESYCATENPVKEFKDLVKALHKSGIELVMEFDFTNKVTPDYIVDCLRYWVLEYHVDGFHLNGVNLPLTTIARDPLLASTKLMADSFPISEIYENDEIPVVKQLGFYNEDFKTHMRKFLKGDENMISSFLYFNKLVPKKYAVMNYIANHNGFTLMDLVSYNAKHNEANQEANQDGNNYNYSWNCGVEGKTRKKKVMELRYKQIKNALALTFLSQGTPLLQAGDEFGNSQEGNNNPYCQDNELGYVDWKQFKKNSDLFTYVKMLIQFRKSHSVLHMNQEPQIMDWKSYGYPDLSYHSSKAWYADMECKSCNVGLMYCEEYGNVAEEKKETKKIIKRNSAGEPIHLLYIAYNPHWNEQLFALPTIRLKGEWEICMDTSHPEVNGFYHEKQAVKLTNQKEFIVPPRSVMILTGKSNVNNRVRSGI